MARPRLKTQDEISQEIFEKPLAKLTKEQLKIVEKIAATYGAKDVIDMSLKVVKSVAQGKLVQMDDGAKSFKAYLDDSGSPVFNNEYCVGKRKIFGCIPGSHTEEAVQATLPSDHPWKL